MDVRTILSQIDLGSIALPEFQRGYVWNRDQVRGLMTSLYRKYPVGSLMVWVTPTEVADVRGGGMLAAGTVDLLLDGQQRVTTLYGIIRGRAPRFFDGDASAFTGLHFDIEDEVFEFYAPAKMKGNPRWISVTQLMTEGVAESIKAVFENPDLSLRAGDYVNRLTRLDAVKDIEFHVEKVVGEDKTIEVVVDIFNRVNSGGTKLSKGDLALARICASWPDARDEMKKVLRYWSDRGFHFQLDWLLRNITTIVAGEAKFAALTGVTTSEFQEGLKNATKSANVLLNVIGARLGLDHDRVLGGRYAFPVMTRYLSTRGGKFHSAIEQDKLLYWYIQSFLWGRFAGSVETVLNQDLDLVDGTEASIDRLIQQIRLSRGDLTVRDVDFSGWSLGARFYPMLYLLTRMQGARDWGAPFPVLSAGMLGKGAALEIHHIFPKAHLYRHDYQRSEVNALANFCFLTKDTNIAISDSAPRDYFRKIATDYPGALESQWIPMDEQLWEVDRYRDFLAARRALLADAANHVLENLLHPAAGAPVDTALELELGAAPDVAEAMDPVVTELLAWIGQQGISQPNVDQEIADPETQELIIVGDLVWPNGVQEGLSDPVVFEFEAEDAAVSRLAALGYRVFTTPDAFKRYLMAPPELASAEEVAPEPSTAAAERFHQAMLEVHDRAKREAGYNASRFLSMVSDIGGLETAKRLLQATDPSEGFVALWSKGRLDLSVEAQALRPEFQGLFSEEALHRARQRLVAVGYAGPADVAGGGI
ncbi:MAG: DUF262 domain-containing protein [Chloroflexota bacterium]